MRLKIRSVLGFILLITLGNVSLAGEVVPRPLDGFKELKFGMDVNQVQRIGFKCESNSPMPVCERVAVNGSLKYEPTFLGELLGIIPKEAYDLRLKEHFSFFDGGRLEVVLNDGKLDRISIIAPLDQEEVNVILTRELGEPFIYEKGEPHEKLWRTWVFSNGAMITTSPHLSMPFNSYVSYTSSERASKFYRSELLSWGLDTFIDPKAMKDF